MYTKKIEFLKDIMDKAPQKSGIYKMLDKNNNILYIGKAKNIAVRLKSYLAFDKLVYKNFVMINKVEKIETFITSTEAEALILEGDLIKKYRPPYNILLMDDKSYPYIVFSNDNVAKISKFRGNIKGMKHFGPFASTGSVDSIIKILQNVFGLRTCTNIFYKNLSRPCLLYQIKKCSGPCSGLITEDEYKSNVNKAYDFLKGKNIDLKENFINEMERLSKGLEFEKAGIVRDKIKSINDITSVSLLNIFKKENAHVFALYNEGEKCCIVANFFENGFSKGFDKFFPQQIEGLSNGEILEQFLSLFYKSNILPKVIYLSNDMENERLFQEAYLVKISIPKTGNKLEFINQSKENAKKFLSEKYNQNKEIESTLNQLQNDAKIESDINRIDVFDNSHLSKSSPIGAMIVFKDGKFSKKDYRHYNLDLSTNGDDLKMMGETIYRRYNKRENLPDLILIDGGKTQMNAVKYILGELQLEIPVICIAKGEARNSRNETIYYNDDIIKYEKGHKVLLFLERLRDEVHHFAITFNRKKRTNLNFTSALDKIENIGAGRKKALMNYFGSVANIKEAGINELMKVQGISKSTAEKIKEYFK